MQSPARSHTVMHIGTVPRAHVSPAMIFVIYFVVDKISFHLLLFPGVLLAGKIAMDGMGTGAKLMCKMITTIVAHVETLAISFSHAILACAHENIKWWCSLLKHSYLLSRSYTIQAHCFVLLRSAATRAGLVPLQKST